MPVPLQCIGVIAASAIDKVQQWSSSLSVCSDFETIQLTSCNDSSYGKTWPSKSLLVASEVEILHLKSQISDAVALRLSFIQDRSIVNESFHLSR